MRKWAVLLLLLLGTFSGCAFAAVKKPDPDGYAGSFQKTREVSLDRATALDVARSALEGLGYEVQAVNPDLGFVRSKTHQIQIGDTCWCGRWNGEVVTGTAESSVTIAVRNGASSGGTLLEIEHVCGTTFTGTNLYGVPTVRQTYQCASKGELEKRYWGILDQVLLARGIAR